MSKSDDILIENEEYIKILQALILMNPQSFLSEYTNKDGAE